MSGSGKCQDVTRPDLEVNNNGLLAIQPANPVVNADSEMKLLTASTQPANLQDVTCSDPDVKLLTASESSKDVVNSDPETKVDGLPTASIQSDKQHTAAIKQKLSE